ncbi:MAG: preprotein translocase subunit SecE [Fibrobacterota bacterium]
MNAIITYFNNVVAELKKVVWPTRDMLVASTLMVIIISLIFAIYILGVDKLLSLVVGLILE